MTTRNIISGKAVELAVVVRPLLRVRAGPPLLRPLERLLVLPLHLVSGCSHGCSMLLPGLGLGLGLRACSVVDSSKPNETIRLELATR